MAETATAFDMEGHLAGLGSTAPTREQLEGELEKRDDATPEVPADAPGAGQNRLKDQVPMTGDKPLDLAVKPEAAPDPETEAEIESKTPAELLEAKQKELDDSKRDGQGQLNQLIQARRERAALREEVDGLKGTVKEIEAKAETPAPDKEEDPMGYIAWQHENVVAPLVKKVESLETGAQVTLAQQQFQAGMSVLEAHIVERVGDDQQRGQDFKSARDFLVNGYERGLVEKGIPIQEARQQVAMFALQSGANAIEAKQDFTELVLEEARKNGWEKKALEAAPAAEEQKVAVAKVKRGIKSAPMAQSKGGNTQIGRGTRVTQAMMSAPDGEYLTHAEKMAIIGDTDHRKDLVTKGETYLRDK